MTKTFYKATRLNGRSFFDGTTEWVVGQTVNLPPLSDSSEYEVCTSSVLHASDEPAETLLGGSWPCRLFEVTGEPVCHEGHKHGFVALTVVREIESWRALGPNGQEVVALIERARTLTADEVGRLRAALDAARNAAWNAALDAARNAARNAAWNAAWNAARNAARNAAWNAALDAARNAARDAARDEALGYTLLDAVLDAVLALLVRDLLTEEQFQVLVGSWLSVVSLPEITDATS
jgi:hypothetical protein